ncbi:MAG: ShlB/FhaC/HecB family hemolysin secretion/activation protein [Verrucomicrobiia bacterium]|jgi:hemolysin activation/secretion protein
MKSSARRLVVLGLALVSITRARAQEFVAPPLRLAPPGRTLGASSRIFVREFRFEGNTRFSGRELAKVVAPYTGRELSAEELEDARRDVTLYYVTHGYINSGAVLPEQDAQDGTVVLRIIEGQLTGITLTGNRWLRSSYVTDRLQKRVGSPLNVDRLRDGLQLLRDNPNVEQVNAELRPGALPGESYLNLRLREQQPFRIGVQVDNERPPSVGSEEVLLLATDRNLTGHSDPLDLTYGIAEGGSDRWKASGSDNIGGSYSIPFTGHDTTFRIYGNRNDFAIIEAAFVTNNVDVTSESYRAGASLRQPLYQTAHQELAIALTFERRSSETFIDGKPADISPGSINGREEISALRFSQEWMGRDQDQVLALRSTMSWGVHAFNITDNGTNRDARFFSWQGQTQYVRRLLNTPNQLIVRLQGQWTDDKLLSLEQFSLGGAESVRGYRENELLLDRGLEGTVEFRLPVLLNGAGESLVQFAPFFDFGGGSDVGEPTPHPTTISSAGIGLLLTPNKHVNAQLYWGHPFANLNDVHNDPQDLGLHFKVSVETF